MNDTICQVAWETIRVSPFQPRRIFSEEEIDELAHSIKTVGLIHPPVVRKIESQGKLLYYELIAGERRWRASKKAGLDPLPVLIRESSDEQAARATLIENLQRVDLDPMETALALKKLIDVFGMTQEAVAEKVGKKRSTVANYLRLLTLPKQIQEGLSKGEITMGHAKAILSLEGAELQKQLHEMILRTQMTVRETEKESGKISKQKGTKAKSKASSYREVEEKLQATLGTKVSLLQEGKGGRLILHYYSLDDLERLLQFFSI